MKQSLPLLGLRLTERFCCMLGLAPEIPEDLYMLIKKVIQIAFGAGPCGGVAY